MKLCLGGDFSLGDTYLADWARRPQRREPLERLQNAPERFVDPVAPFFAAGRRNIVNLETVLTHAEQSPLEGKKKFLGRDDPARTVALLHRLHVEAVSLANNHTRDFGDRGLLDTMHHLAVGNIGFFGAGDRDSAQKPFTLTADTGRRVHVVGGMRFRSRYARSYNHFAATGNFGIGAFRAATMVERIETLRRDDPEASIVVFPHWGTDYELRSDGMRGSAERWVAAGADLIVGHGTHVLTEIECIDGVPVCYSLGNLVFNSPGRYQRFGVHPYSAVAHVDIGSEGLEALRLYPVVTDNRRTGFRTRPADARESRFCHERLCDDAFALDRDALGWHLAFAR